MICKNDIATLKTNIGEMIGQKVIVKGSLGRNKPFVICNDKLLVANNEDELVEKIKQAINS